MNEFENYLTEKQYKRLCHELCDQWRSQSANGIWASRTAYIPDDVPKVVWRNPHKLEKVKPEECQTILPDWKSLYYWMKGYEMAAECRRM